MTYCNSGLKRVHRDKNNGVKSHVFPSSHAPKAFKRNRTREHTYYSYTLSMVTVGQSPWDDINILELGLGHLISKF